MANRSRCILSECVQSYANLPIPYVTFLSHFTAAGTGQELLSDVLDDTQLPFTLANILTAMPPSDAAEGPAPVGLSISAEPAYEAMDATAFLGDIFPEPQVPSPVEEEPSTESAALVWVFSNYMPSIILILI